MAWKYGQEIWNNLLADIKNEIGVSALMGNLLAESDLTPFRVEGDYSSGYADSLEYTQKVDSGVISESAFVNNGYGYGLAQWTYYTRKQNLYDMSKEMGVSIGSTILATTFLLYELKNTYPTVYSALTNATDLRTASDIVLHDFEKPKNQSEEVEIKRYNYGVSIYEEYKGTYTDNSTIIENAIEWCLSIADDDTHGYDQTSRWGPDYDCSSFLIQAFENAGCPVKTNGATYTGDMIDVFVSTGFEKISYSTSLPLVRGDVLWREGHTELYIGNNQNVGAHYNENGGATGGVTGDQTGYEISVDSTGTNWVWVLRLANYVNPDNPDNPDLPYIPLKRKKFNFLLFKKKRWIV